MVQLVGCTNDTKGLVSISKATAGLNLNPIPCFIHWLRLRSRVELEELSDPSEPSAPFHARLLPSSSTGVDSPVGLAGPLKPTQRTPINLRP